MADSELILDGHKLLWHRDRVEAWLRGERIAPITIECSITRKCCYRCVYCYGQLQENPGEELSRSEIACLMDDAAAIGVRSIALIGDGENTCSPYLEEAILRGRSNGLDIGLGTNGYLLGGFSLDNILKSLTYLRFNISAASPDRYAEIHGCNENCFKKTIEIIKNCVAIKRSGSLPVTIGLQMVLLPDFADQVVPLAELGKELGVDYFVIKHCMDDVERSLGVEYGAYDALRDTLERAEAVSGKGYQVTAKWTKIMSGGKRRYSHCYGPPFLLQISGTGLVAPCGAFFNEKHRKFHIGSLKESSLREIWESDRYWEIMTYLGSDDYDPVTQCGPLCMQDKINEFLFNLRDGGGVLPVDAGERPMHVNFI